MAQSKEEKLEARIDKLVAANDDKTNDIKRLRRRLKTSDEELEIVKDMLEVERRILSSTPNPPKWLVEKRKKDKRYRATAIQCWSDFHFGEVQTPEEVNGFNAYNDDIAEKRFKHLNDSTIQIVSEHTAGIDFDGIVLAGLGDYISGAIHEELTKTNSETVFETVVRYAPLMISAVKALAEKFDKVYCPWMMGNHDRNTPKVESKRGPQETISWILAHWVADYFKDDPQVQFYIPRSWEGHIQVHNTRFILTHGYGAPTNRYGAALALMKEREKFARRDGVAGYSDEVLLMAHYHQTVFTPEAIMSGCLKGIDAYAYKLKCPPAPPSQALVIVTPEHGITANWTVNCEAKNERKLWNRVTYTRQMLPER